MRDAAAGGGGGRKSFIRELVTKDKCVVISKDEKCTHVDLFT